MSIGRSDWTGWTLSPEIVKQATRKEKLISEVASCSKMVRLFIVHDLKDEFDVLTAIND